MGLRIIVWVMMLVGGGALGIWVDLQLFRPLFSNLPFHLLSLAIGVILLRFVLTVSRNTGRFLSKMGRRGDISRMDTNILVKEGMYACMRHPMHFGLLFFPWSIAFILGSPTFITLIAPLEVILMIVMIKLGEEREAIAKFGDEYRAYMREVPMFCLRPDCLRMLLEEVPKEE